VRIEVGYGLEGIMTDAVSASIVQQIMLPMFKKGDFSGGLLAGTEAIVLALGGQYAAPSASGKGADSGSGLPSLIFLFIFMSIGAMNRLGGRRSGSSLWMLPLLLLSGGGGGGRSSGGGFGGFSGGGGGFGGGGASGGW